MKTVYLLFHTHDLGYGETDDKLIGAYLSRPDAEQAQRRTAKLKGFCDALDGFVIDAYEIGRDHWDKGYVTVVSGRPLPRET